MYWEWILLITLILVILWVTGRKEALAPMLKRALGGQELSYESQLGPGFYPPSSDVKVLI